MQNKEVFDDNDPEARSREFKTIRINIHNESDRVMEYIHTTVRAGKIQEVGRAILNPGESTLFRGDNYGTMRGVNYTVVYRILDDKHFLEFDTTGKISEGKTNDGSADVYFERKRLDEMTIDGKTYYTHIKGEIDKNRTHYVIDSYLRVR